MGMLAMLRSGRMIAPSAQTIRPYLDVPTFISCQNARQHIRVIHLL
jgi:hypothetical protein